MRMFFLLITVLTFMPAADCRARLFGVARVSAPVLNSPDFKRVFGGKDGSTMKTDRCGRVRELEYIALPGTVFKMLEELRSEGSKIYQVETEEYTAPAGIRLYVDSRFLEMKSDTPPPRKRSLPSREQVSASLLNAVGTPYVWGGNVQSGVPELSNYFYHNVGNSDRKQLTLTGLDCSGLLYQATDGWTPRNTSELISFGRPVAIKGKNAVEIAGMLEPLDLVVWNGHLVIVLDSETVIESRLECGKPRNGGVVTTPLRERLAEIMRTRRPSDKWPTTGKRRDLFVVRRWYSQQ